MLSLMKAGLWIYLLVGLLFSGVAFGQATIKKEIDVAFSDLESVRPILKEALTPAGKFVLLPQKGSVLVIDTPAGIAAAEKALSSAGFADPSVALGFRFVTGLPTKNSQLIVGQEVPLPVEYAPPTIVLEPFRGGLTVVPAVPTKFETRIFGVVSESRQTLNPDGSITIDSTVETSSLDGFIDYGSAIFPAGGVGVVPVNGSVGNPTFFVPFIDAGAMPVPIISTTRVSTSVVVRPRVHLGQVHLDMIPRLRFEEGVAEEEARYEPFEVDLRQFQTTLTINNKEVGRAYGFNGTSDEFNNRFFGAKDPYSGRSAVMVKAQIGPPLETEESTPEEEETVPIQQIKGTPQVVSPPSSPAR
ncbi:MAG: hypothetical protein AAGF67_09450 [Verrucomicrobiota bacterium]